MLKVGIFTPYVRNEITLAAVQFADWLVRCGIDVYMLSDGKVESGIHPTWDTKIKRGCKRTVYPWAYGSTHLCWFSNNKQAIRWSKRMGFTTTRSRLNHYYFPHWIQNPDDDWLFLTLVDKVICLNKPLFDWIEGIGPLCGIPISDPVWSTLVSSDKVLIPRHGRVDKDTIRLMVLCTKDMVLDIGIALFGEIERLLQKHKTLSITALLERSVPRSYRTFLSRLHAIYGPRISWVTNPPYYKYVKLARKHDWVYLANTRNLIGSQLAALISSSVPLICHDVPPVRSYVDNGVTGRLIPCKVHYENVPIAEINMDVVGNHLDAILTEQPIVLKAMQLTGHERYRQQQKAFEEFIYKEFVT